MERKPGDSSETTPIIIRTAANESFRSYDKDIQKIGPTESDDNRDNSQIENGVNNNHSNSQHLEPEREGVGKFKFSEVPKKKKIIVCLCTLANFLGAVAYSCIAPFFPLVANEKGMSLTEIGFVFGLYQLVVFLASPFVGNFMIRLGVRFMFFSGIFIGGCSTVLFGILDKGPDGAIFLTLCIFVRFIEALGFAAFITSSMTIVSSEFEKHASSVLVFLRSGAALGNMLGPFLAGLLYDFGGFGLPFYVVGVTILLNGLVIYIALPPLQSEQSCNKRDKTIMDLMRSPLVVVAMMSVFLGVCTTQLYASAFANLVEPFKLTSSIVGAIYAVGPVFYALLTPLWGYITDIKDKQSILLVPSFFAAFVGWEIARPGPLLPFLPFTLWNVGFGSVLLGSSLGCQIIAPIKCMLYGAQDLEYENNPDTLSMVSGLYSSAFALGGFFGPFIGGILIEQYGFSRVFTGTGFLNFAMFLLTLSFFLFRYLKHPKKGKTEQ